MKSAEVTPLDQTATLQEEVKQQFSRQEVEALCARYRADLQAAIRAGAGPQASLAVEDVLEWIDAQALRID
jgi:hypothetical protein